MANTKQVKSRKAQNAVFDQIPMGLIAEPPLPARGTMSDKGMQDLITSFKEIGQIEPITVKPDGDGYTIVTGHRRYLAARQLGWSEISARVLLPDQANTMAMMLHENIVREQLNPAEEALFMAQAREQMDLDEDGLCELFKRPANYIASRFALLRGDPEIFSALQRGEIRIGVAHELNRIKEETMRRNYLDIARRTDPTQRAVHQWVNDWEAQCRFQQQGSAGNGEATAGNGGGAGVTEGGGAEGAAGDGGQSPAPAPFFGCELCGGARDPYNLVTVRLHKWEWDMIQKQVEKAARGE